MKISEWHTPIEKLVLRVNEVYHDLEENYEKVHPEIFQKEKQRWVNVACELFDLSKGLTVIDVGSGTGFVALTTAGLLGGKDVFICSDISGGILKMAESSLKKQKFTCEFKFVKIPNQIPFKLPFENKQADIITINSVLHHIENTKSFLSEVDRVLKPGGLIFIGHEPNSHFYQNKFLYFQDYLLYAILNPRVVIRRLTKGANWCSLEVREKINKILLKEKLIESPLSNAEIGSLVDIKSRIGFAPENLFPKYETLYLETYNHIYRVSSKCSGKIIKAYEKILQKKYPKAGLTFFLVIKKPTTIS